MKSFKHIITTILCIASLQLGAMDQKQLDKKLLTAAYNGNTQQVEQLIQAGASANAKNDQQCTALYFASEKGHTNVVKVLLENGASVDTKFKGQWTPLYVASQNGHTEVAKLLIKSGASIDAKNNNNWTPIHIASEKGRTDIVQLLLENNASVNAKCISECMSPMINCRGNCTPIYIAAKNGHVKTVELLLQKGSPINPTNEWGVCSPLFRAIQNNHNDVVQLLLEKEGLNPGDHIYIRRIYKEWEHAYTHHGVYIGEGKIIHYDGTPGSNKYNAKVIDISLKDFADRAIDGKLRVVKYGASGWSAFWTAGGKRQSVKKLPVEEIIKRAKSKLESKDGSGKGSYSPTDNNCEHFANWCCSGRHYSGQTNPFHVLVKLKYVLDRSLFDFNFRLKIIS